MSTFKQILIRTVSGILSSVIALLILAALGIVSVV